MLMFSVFDTKLAAFGTPFYMPKENVAIRTFNDLTNDPKSSIYKHPEDYTLYLLGNFNDETGLVESQKPHPMLNAAGLSKKDQQINLQQALLEQNNNIKAVPVK